MKHHMNASRFGSSRYLAPALLAGAISLVLAGCHVDPIESSSGGGAAPAAATSQTQASANTGSITSSQATRIQAQSQTAEAAQCNPFPSGRGMVYKPVSEGDGRLVVLLPSSNAISAGAAMADRTGKIVERGRSVGRTNGNRPTFRFSRPGRGYPSPGILVVGSSRYCIPDTARRND